MHATLHIGLVVSVCTGGLHTCVSVGGAYVLEVVLAHMFLGGASMVKVVLAHMCVAGTYMGLTCV
jgi:mannose/fructose/N-acetylgalactosamine-specific phosphotransferase system component IIC